MRAAVNRGVAVALFGLALCAAAPARADDDTCRMALGRGWPSATENYGTAVEKLLGTDAPAALRLTILTKVGTERGLLLIPDPAGGDWTLRYAQAEERVRIWENGQLLLRTTEAPEVNEAPIPATVATRLLDEWSALLATAAPEGSTAPFSEDDTWVFVAGDLRVSGVEPGCKLGERLRDQVELLIEASDEGVSKRERRWQDLDRMLDRLRREREASLGSVANAP